MASTSYGRGGDSPQYLKNRVHVTGVSQVPEASDSRSQGSPLSSFITQSAPAAVLHLPQDFVFLDAGQRPLPQGHLGRRSPLRPLRRLRSDGLFLVQSVAVDDLLPRREDLGEEDQASVNEGGVALVLPKEMLVISENRR